jgi:outer membrane lipoprotein carrier protein
MRLFNFFSALLFAGIFSIAAAQPDDPLLRYFKDLQSLRADFVQTVFDDQNQILQSSSGRVFMRRPGKFRWDYQKPYKQLIVADGERLWLYDIDLEQVTVKKLDQSISAAPLAVLSGATPVEQAFTVSKVATQDKLQWYELHPKQQQSEFNLLRIAFADGTLRTLELEDNLQRRTRLDLTNVERNPVLDSSLFRFTPPAGVDVVGDL